MKLAFFSYCQSLVVKNTVMTGELGSLSPESHHDTSRSSFHCFCESESHLVSSDSLRPRPWNSPGQNTGVAISLLQGIIPTQGLNPGLPHCRWILYQLSHKGSPWLLYHLCKYQHAFKRQISPSCCYENNFDFTDFLRNLRDPQDPWAAS